ENSTTVRAERCGGHGATRVQSTALVRCDERPAKHILCLLRWIQARRLDRELKASLWIGSELGERRLVELARACMTRRGPGVASLRERKDCDRGDECKCDDRQSGNSHGLSPASPLPFECAVRAVPRAPSEHRV